MVTFSNFRFIFPSYILIFFFFDPISSSPIRTLTHKPNFDSDIALIGAAEVVNNGGSYIKLHSSLSPSFGLLIHTKPLRLDRSTLFHTHFTFSISPNNGDGLVLSLFSENMEFSPEKGFHSIEFVTASAGNVSNLSGSFMKTEMGVLVPNAAGKMTSWVDYDSSSQKLEVRLSKFGESRPFSPLFAYSIDLVDKCKGEEVFMGLSSLISNSSQFSTVFSWRIGLRNVPEWMHSLPVDPRRYSDESEEHLHENRRLRPLTIFAGFIFGAAGGALLAFVVLFMWAIVANRHTVFPDESGDFGYEKVSVVVEEESEDDDVRG